MSEQPNERAQKAINSWIDALKSGRYTQSDGVLRSEYGYCCLGVLCDVVDPEAWRVFELDRQCYLFTEEGSDIDVDGEPGVTTLPDFVMDSVCWKSDHIGSFKVESFNLHVPEDVRREILKRARNKDVAAGVESMGLGAIMMPDEAPLASLTHLNDSCVSFGLIVQIIKAMPWEFVDMEPPPNE